MTLELISNALCPYTQRAAIQLLELGVPFGRCYIDLANKPAWFLALSPLGKVPVLRADDKAIFESSAICEYINDIHAPSLHPESPLERARHRAWIEFSSAMITDIFLFYTAAQESAFLKKAADLATKMEWLDQNLSGKTFFSGTEFRLVDGAFAPIFRLFETIDGIDDFGIFRNCTRVASYRAALAQRPSVRNAVVPDYDGIFIEYLAGQQSHFGAMVRGRRPSQMRA